MEYEQATNLYGYRQRLDVNLQHNTIYTENFIIPKVLSSYHLQSCCVVIMADVEWQNKRMDKKNIFIFCCEFLFFIIFRTTHLASSGSYEHLDISECIPNSVFVHHFIMQVHLRETEYDVDSY